MTIETLRKKATWELKANNMLMASCIHDDDQYSFIERFVDYTKKEVINKLKDQIKERKGKK